MLANKLENITYPSDLLDTVFMMQIYGKKRTICTRVGKKQCWHVFPVPQYPLGMFKKHVGKIKIGKRSNEYDYHQYDTTYHQTATKKVSSNKMINRRYSVAYVQHKNN